MYRLLNTVLLMTFSISLWSQVYTNQCNNSTAKDLTIGNIFIYKESHNTGKPMPSDYIKMEILGDTVCNGVKYIYYNNNPFVNTYICERADSNKVYKYSIKYDTEILSYDLSWEVGDTVLWNYIVTDNDTAQIFGERLKRVYLYKHEDNYSYSIEFFQKFGLTRSSSYYMSGDGGSTILCGAIINGIEYGDITSVVQNQDNITRPSEFRLFQNYPNPFNPTTTIKFDIPEDCNIEIIIYNTMGHKIITLFDQYSLAGSYEVLWDGKDKNGQIISSGIYIYRINTDTFHALKKLTFIK